MLSIFIKYVSLNILGMIGLSCYILADTFFIARGIGADGIAALNIAIPISNFINGLGLMLGMGSATKYTLLKTKNENEEANIVVSNSFVYVFIISAFFIIIGILFTENIAYILGASDSIHTMTSIYIKVSLLFSPAYMTNHVLLGFVRNYNKPKLAMIAMLAGSLFNTIFDYIFIFSLNMGMFGAVFATGFSPILSIIIILFALLKYKDDIFIKKISVSFSNFFEISFLGISFLITEISSGIVIIIFNIVILNISGNIGVSAYGIIANISIVITAIFTGMGQGIQPLISSNYGNNENINKVYKYAFALSLSVSIIVYVITVLFANEITSLFNRDNDAILQQIAVNGIHLYFIAFIFVGYNIINAVYFSAIENPRQSFIISILRGFLFIVPSISILAYLFNMNGVWISFAAAEFLTAIISILFFVNHKKVISKL